MTGIRRTKWRNLPDCDDEQASGLHHLQRRLRMITPISPRNDPGTHPYWTHANPRLLDGSLLYSSGETGSSDHLGAGVNQFQEGVQGEGEGAVAGGGEGGW